MEQINRVFGLHFDFHADDQTEIGMNTKEEDIERYLIDMQPHYIQCDCKGHPGYACYPTKVGTPAPGLKKDNLRVWANAAKKHGIPLFVHYSGVIDKAYIKEHPEQAQRDEQGGYYEHCPTSVFTDYEEKLLIPQLKELITEYDIAGAWVDGEVWAVYRDFSDNAKPYLHENMTKAEHGKVMREGYFRYAKRYTDALHEFKPDFKVIVNWLYSTYVPEKPVIDVDFLSGDLLPADSAHHVRLESRMLGIQGKPWDLMAWSFSSPNKMDKSSVQLCQEAAAVMTQGGGFSMYITQNRDGSAKQYTGTRWKEIADFIHKREFLYNKVPLAQIGILYSADSFYEKNDCFNHAGAADKLIGALNVLLDSGYTANIVLEWQLDQIDSYEMLVIPEWEFISEENKKKLIAYAENGGKLIVMGAACSAQFAEQIGRSVETTEAPIAFIRDKDGYYATLRLEKAVTVPLCDLKKGSGFVYDWSGREEMVPSYDIQSYGNGTIAFIPFDLGSIYFDIRGFVFRNYIKDLLSQISEKLVTVNQSFIDVTMQKAEQGTYLNLVNMSQGRHSLSYAVFDEVPTAYRVEAVINRICKNVSSPLGEDFTWRTENGKTIISLEKLDVHAVFLLEE